MRVQPGALLSLSVRFAMAAPRSTANASQALHRLRHTMLWATLALVPIATIVSAPWGLQPGAEALFAAAIQGVFCPGAALVLCFSLQPTLGSMGVVSQAHLRAGFGVLLGILSLGEEPAWTISAGVVLAILRRRLDQFRQHAQTPNAAETRLAALKPSSGQV